MTSIYIDGKKLDHGYPFDPSYGYSREDLLAIEAPPEPDGFAEFWQNRYQRARNQSPDPRLSDTGKRLGNWKVYDLSYQSTDSFTINGWALLPENSPIRRSFLIGHGYGGRDEPDPHLPFEDAALLFPCSRGISRSRAPGIPSDPNQHVIHQIDDPDRYIIGGCVDDIWVGVSAMLELFPETAGNANLLGISFSGGTNALAAPWEERIARMHSNVPTFGHHPLRMKLATVGSGSGVQQFEQRNPGAATRTLSFFDAASTAKYMKTATHLACARFDPAVAPPGQFAIYNALPESVRQLFTLTAGHHEYASQKEEDTSLLQELREFFTPTK
ncbi:acetylxylan esterase [Pelagicoccus albus]|uniref:Acetylxylan esterase n=1 Tax=Pelagicoccus albus TaxID=415222 RepID=A0A7X1E8U8_9BACT|nr:acetylxylan esterase [Pelagicoccus albus]MBC2606739.1 acetylxylan esterase [Pelagicoccus albus]